MSNTEILWLIFGVTIPLMLFLDLRVFHRRSHVIHTREALIWSGVWIGLALLYNLAISILLGHEQALLFLTGFITEKSLSIDNLFVFYVIFTFFSVPAAYQHRVLFWGVVGAVVMRGIFILAGLAVIERFHWSVYIFGAFLIYTGIRLMTAKELKFRPEANPVIRLVRRFVPFILEYREDHFFVRQNGRRVATLLFLVVVVVEATDVLFAVDSVPAILAITLDPLIVYTSNIFAILGLRALYFALAGGLKKLRYLNYGLAVVLAFLGFKMIASEFIHIPIPVALAVIAGVLGIAVAVSLLRTQTPPASAGGGEQPPASEPKQVSKGECK